MSFGSTFKSHSVMSNAIKTSRDLLKELQSKHKIPGLSLAVSVNAEMVWKEGFGYADLETQTACTSETVMKIASISKSVCSLLLARLVQEVHLDLDEDIRTYLPDLLLFSWQGQEVQVTARQLASHKSGIRAYKPAHNEYGYEEYAITEVFPSVASALPLFIQDPLISKPGDLFAYSNHGYTLLSRVLEAASQKSLQQLLHRLFTSLHLTSTCIEAEKPSPANSASYYSLKDNELLKCPRLQSSYKIAAAGLLSTAEDLLTFANSIIRFWRGGTSNKSMNMDAARSKHAAEDCTDGYCGDGGAVSPAMLEQLWRGEEGTKVSWWPDGVYGLGWQRVQQDGCLHVGHTGRTVGGSSVLLLSLPEDGLARTKEEADDGAGRSDVAVVILSNMGGVSMGEVALKISAVFRECLAS